MVDSVCGPFGRKRREKNVLLFVLFKFHFSFKSTFLFFARVRESRWWLDVFHTLLLFKNRFFFLFSSLLHVKDFSCRRSFFCRHSRGNFERTWFFYINMRKTIKANLKTHPLTSRMLFSLKKNIYNRFLTSLLLKF